MLHIGLIGCGRWGRHILRDLLALGCQVHVVDPDEAARLHALAARATETYSDVSELPAVDGIVVATPTATHAAVIDRVLDRDVPIFCEKPLTADPVAARRLAEQAAHRVFVMDKWRYHPGIEALADVAASGDIGAIEGLRCTQIGWGCPHGDVDPVWILAPHCLSIALEIFGEIPSARQAFVERLAGQVVGMWARLGQHPWVTFDVSARSPQKVREFRLQGSHGVAWLDEGLADHVKIVRGDDPLSMQTGPIETRRVSTQLPLFRELEAFVRHVQGGPPPKSDARAGYQTVERIAELFTLADMPFKEPLDARGHHPHPHAQPRANSLA